MCAQNQSKLPFKPVSNDNPSQIAEASLSLFIAEHCSFLTIDHLSDILKNIFADSKSADGLHLHRTKCSEIVREVIAPHFIREIIKDIGDKKYSLILDESTDISVTKLLGLVVRYVSLSQKKIISTFLSLVPIKSGTAVDVASAVIDTLNSFGLNPNNLLGIGTDNASTMIGVNNGVHALLKRDLNLPNLILIKCTCHSIQLAVTHASEDTLPRNIEFLIRETYNWFSISPNRQV